jgi:hypothetical protein
MATHYEKDRATIATAKEGARTKIKEVYRNVPPVPADCIPPAAALSVLDAAIATAKTSTASGELGRTMPRPSEKTKPVR